MTDTARRIDDQLVADLVTSDPRRAAVFESYGVDYCCGGGVPLTKACTDAGLDLDEVRAKLDDATAEDSARTDWSEAGADEVLREIEERYHVRIRGDLERLEMLAGKVARAHGARVDGLVEARIIVDTMAEELLAHTDDEERTVFPACRTVIDGARAGADTDSAELARSIDRLVDEHTAVAGHLADLRGLLNDFDPPEDACTTWRAYLDALDRFEQDLHRHVHLENHVLFPQVKQLLATAGAS